MSLNPAAHISTFPLPPSVGVQQTLETIFPRSIMPTLHLIIFKPIPMFPGTAHWGLFLPYDEGDADGLVYQVKKQSFTSNKTEFNAQDFDPRLQSSEFSSCIALPEISIKHHILSGICYDISQGRPFHLVNRNCRDWVGEVIEKLVIQLNMQTTEGERVIRRIKDMK